ncbi:RHS repeat-associated core domain-containing protein [Denitratisoma oestradiolicum]|uniref:Uncharacterized protein n=1 Tax=Denitratisoma oestradiolicum TaxID=311182 RepID=A0A6S6XZA7_9PROT|nr:RHS repeat-associated core domain-containing protein [Denitratisoma oestradiolicum]TWO79982.1 hypothetical protein CBW56_11720 [Denitratisoma oestradiolicum]CAB1369747.1 exported protein of unknown function [Denitratisoma oestradiolicum]
MLATCGAFRWLAAFLSILVCLIPSLAPAKEGDSSKTAVRTLLFGPQTYVAGAPAQREESFDIPEGVIAPFVLWIESGEDGEGRNGPSKQASQLKASIELNGVTVVPLARFPNDAAEFEVSLKPKGNRLRILMPVTGKGKRPWQFTLSVLGRASPSVPVSLAPDPLALGTGAEGRLIATLTPSPRQSGRLTVATDDTTIVKVPASVEFERHQSQVRIPVKARGPGHAQVQASLDGASVSAAVQVIPRGVRVTALEPARLTLAAGATGSLAVRLNAARNNDVAVDLTSQPPGRVSLPARVTVPAGETRARFALTARQAGSARIVARLNKSEASSLVTVSGSLPSVVGLAPTTATLNLGTATDLELTLSAAPATPLDVQITASPEGLVAVPATVTVPAGTPRATFPVAAVGFGQATVTARANGGSAASLLQVVPVDLKLVGLSPTPLRLTVGAIATLGVDINAIQPGNTDIALTVAPEGIVAVPPSVTLPQGQTHADFTVTGLIPGDAILTATANANGIPTTQATAALHVSPQPAHLVSLLPNPLPLQQGAAGSLSLAIDTAQETDTDIPLTNDAPAIVQAPEIVTLPAGQTSTGIPLLALAPGSAQLSVTLNGSRLVTRVDVSPPPPVVIGFTPPQLTLPKGRPGGLHVLLDRAPNAPVTVALLSSAPAIAAVPASVTVPAGALEAEFPVSALAEGSATITANLNGASVSTTVTIAPPEPSALVIAPQNPTVFATDSIALSATTTLTDGSERDDTARVAWTVADPAIASIASDGTLSALAAGATPFQARLDYTDSQGAPGHLAQSTSLTVKAASALGLSTATGTLTVGESADVIVTSADPADSRGLAVTLTTDVPGLDLPATVRIEPGQGSAVFRVTAVAPGTPTLSASAPGRTPARLSFTLRPPYGITGMTPTAGPVGTPVTLTGINFDPDPAKNDVRFNGERAVVGSARLTELKVIVPVRAGSGPVTLTTTRGLATAPSPFEVQALQGFDIRLAPAAVQIPLGGNGATRVTLASVGLAAYRQGVSLAVTGLPPGLTAQAVPVQLAAGSDVMLNFSAATGVAPGNYSLTITGTGPLDLGTATRSAPLSVTVLDASATTVSGRVLHAEDDRPFVGARLRLGGQETYTDETGAYRFLNPAVLGDQVILIDGHTANTEALRYPSAIAMPVMIQAGRDNLALTSYLQAVDAAKAVTIVPGQATSVMMADLPNYSLNIPQGAILYGWDGTPVTQINVRTVPVDRLPIKPLPEGVEARTVYLYYFFREGGANPTQPIPVTLINDTDAEPGEKVELWYYDESTRPDPNSNQWRVMGLGTVSDDGKRIVSDPGVGIPKFCCGAGFARNNRPTRDQGGKGGDGKGPTSCNPVDLASGNNLAFQNRPFGIAGRMPLNLDLQYRSTNRFLSNFGRGVTFAYDWGIRAQADVIVLISPDGIRYVLSKEADGLYRQREGRAGAQGWEAWRTGTGTTVRFPDGREMDFGLMSNLAAIRDPNGNRTTFTLSPTTGLIETLTDPGGRTYRFEGVPFGTDGIAVASITDDLGRRLGLEINRTNGNLTRLTDPAGYVTTYEYDSNSRISRRIDPRGYSRQFFYGDYGRTLKEILEDGSEVNYAYGALGSQVVETRMTDANGQTTAYRWNGQGYPTRTTDPLGRSTTETRDFTKNLLLARTDPLGRSTRYTYDAKGNRTSVKDSQGNLTLYDYDPVFNKPTRITDPLGNVTQHAYDGQGNLIATTTPENETTRFTYTPQGQVETVTDPLGRVTRMTYDPQGNLIRTTNPQGNSTDLAYDAANRLAQITSPSGLTARRAYDVLDRLSETTDPQGNVTRITYDPQDRLLSLTDPLGHAVETNTWDARGRLAQRTDAQGQSSTWTYDGNGNPLTATDRQGRITRYAHDAANRLSEVSDPEGRTTRYDYDLADNLARISDNRSGDLLFSYDEQDRLTRIASDQGTVEYRYDVLGRRTQRLINGGDPTDYRYDRAGRITQITYRGKTVSYQYDPAGRLIKKTLPNGITQQYTWDNGDRLTQLKIAKADGTPLETLDYQYDADGKRIQKNSGGSSQPETPMAASYDQANRLTQLTLNPNTPNAKTYTLSYDPQGNLTRKQNSNDPQDSTTYTWDARGRLTQLQSPTHQASFQYDPLGRRISKTVNGSTVQYLYDGQQAIAEIRNNAVEATYHTGIALDEVLARYAASGNRTLLTDALGSVIAQTDENQSPSNWYAYSPYGETQTIGPDNGNPLQYTGRENDGTGLYYYRARYFDPVGKQWLSDDPIGLAGGLNQRAYVSGDPVSNTDPTGLVKVHGNWCGPDWTGGFEKPWDELSVAERASVMAPRDDLDTACMVHDMCYASCRNKGECGGGDYLKRETCMKACDDALAIEAGKYGGLDGFAVSQAMRRPGPRTNMTYEDISNMAPIQPGRKLWNARK